MPSIEAGLSTSGAEDPYDVNTEEGCAARMREKLGESGASSPSASAREQSLRERDARMRRGARSTFARRWTPEEKAKIKRDVLNPAYDEEAQRSVAGNLTYHNEITGEQRGVKPRERKLTGEELQRQIERQKAEYEADPGTQEYRERQAAKSAEEIGYRVDSILLRAHNIQDAYDYGELSEEQKDAALFQTSRELKAVSPERLRELCDQMNDEDIDALVASYGDDVLDEYEESSLRGNQLWAAVEQADQDEAVAKVESANAEIYRIVHGASDAAYHETLKELIPDVNPESEALYSHLKG